MNLNKLAELKVTSPHNDANFTGIVDSFQKELAWARQSITERAASLSRDFLWALWHKAPHSLSVEAKGLGASCALQVCGFKVCAIGCSIFAVEPPVVCWHGISKKDAPEALAHFTDDEIYQLSEACRGYFDMQRQFAAGGLRDDTFQFAYGARGA